MIERGDGNCWPTGPTEGGDAFKRNELGAKWGRFRGGVSFRRGRISAAQEESGGTGREGSGFAVAGGNCGGMERAGWGQFRPTLPGGAFLTPGR